jgi:hypothetical protein
MQRPARRRQTCACKLQRHLGTKPDDSISMARPLRLQLLDKLALTILHDQRAIVIDAVACLLRTSPLHEAIGRRLFERNAEFL